MPVHTSPGAPGLPLDDIRTQRVTTGAVAGGASAVVTVTWPSPFEDTDYTAVVNVIEGDGVQNSLRVLRIVSQTASAITVRVVNDNAISARTGTLHAIAIHD